MSATTASYSQDNMTSRTLPSQQLHDSYDVEVSLDPSAYARKMYLHTKQQMDAATRSARKRSTEGTNAHGSLNHETSMSSFDSRNTQ